jgi:hypothetical protein
MPRWTKVFLAAFLLCLGVNSSQAATVLVTPQEALLPPSPVLTQRGPADGPKVELMGPDGSVVGGTPFHLSAVFKPRPDTNIDPNSVHIILLRGDGIDVTDRVRGAGRIDQTGINLEGLVAPPGEYRIRVLVDDTNARVGFADITLKIDTPH